MTVDCSFEKREENEITSLSTTDLYKRRLIEPLQLCFSLLNALDKLESLHSLRGNQ